MARRALALVPAATYAPTVDATRLPDERDEIAPDGSEVRLLVRGTLGSMAHFRVAPGQVSIPRQHREIEELWYFVQGRGEICVGDETTYVGPGLSLRIPPRTRFQLRCHGDVALEAVAVTMPPWPGAHEAEEAEPFWPPT